MTDTAPRYLFKFFPDHNLLFGHDQSELDKRVAAHKTPYIFCPKPEMLNDPFEFQIKVDAFSSRTEVLEHFRQCKEAGLIDTDLVALEKYLDNGGLEKVKQKSDENNKKAHQNIRNKLRAASFCRRYNSILMWSHYAQEHKGFCIKYDTNALGFQAHFHKVRYKKSNRFPVVKPNDYFDKGKDWYFYQMLATKHVGWRYEKEWRLISQKMEIEFNRNAVKQVLLGVNADKDLYKELLSYYPNADFLKAQVAESRFELKFERL